VVVAVIVVIIVLPGLGRLHAAQVATNLVRVPRRSVRELDRLDPTSIRGKPALNRNAAILVREIHDQVVVVTLQSDHALRYAQTQQECIGTARLKNRIVPTVEVMDVDIVASTGLQEVIPFTPASTSFPASPQRLSLPALHIEARLRSHS